MQVVGKRSIDRGAHEPRAGIAVTRGHGPRRAYLDSLKLLLVAVIIAGHGALAYGDLESAWPYQDVQEVQLGTVSNVVLSAVVMPTALFVMGLFFLMSGLVTPGSVSRHGPRGFVRIRLIRLGLPLVAWTLLLWPGMIWLTALAAGRRHSFWSELTTEDPPLDTGPLWFVEVLLVYSVAYAGWRHWRGRTRTREDGAAPALGWTLAVLATGISLGTILVRLVFPVASGQVGQSHLWQWPQFVAMFGLGIVAAQRGWLDPVPDRTRRACGRAALGGVVAFGLLGAAMAAAGVDGEILFDEPRLHWAPLMLAAIEGPLSVGASVWLLGVAQLRLAGQRGPFGDALVRSSYAAFLLQGIVLLVLMVAMRPLDVPAEVKALTVAGLGVAGSFALAWVLVTRTRLGRLL